MSVPSTDPGLLLNSAFLFMAVDPKAVLSIWGTLNKYTTNEIQAPQDSTQDVY
jgi:hypothetical protein